MDKGYATIKVADGTLMQAYFATPSGAGPFPAIIIFQEAFGVNHHIRSVVERFAAEGYVAVAPELYHRSAPPGFESGYADFSLVGPHYSMITDEGVEADTMAAWDWLQQHSLVEKQHIASIGYCLGGRVSFIANSILPFKAAVCYYGGGTIQQLKRVPSMHAPILFCWGALDNHITPEQVQLIIAEMTNAGKAYVNIVFSDAHHAFFCDERSSYHPQSAKESWALTLAFLKERMV